MNKKNIMTVQLLLNFFLISTAISQTISVFPKGIQYGISVEKTQEKLVSISASLKVVKNNEISLPFAKHEETYLIASNVNLKTGIIDKIVFVFSDDKLTYIEAMGNIQNIFLANLKGLPQMYMGYSVYVEELLFVNANKDRA